MVVHHGVMSIQDARSIVKPSFFSKQPHDQVVRLINRLLPDEHVGHECPTASLPQSAVFINSCAADHVQER